jgi:hypothetical protein
VRMHFPVYAEDVRHDRRTKRSCTPGKKTSKIVVAPSRGNPLDHDGTKGALCRKHQACSAQPRRDLLLQALFSVRLIEERDGAGLSEAVRQRAGNGSTILRRRPHTQIVSLFRLCLWPGSLAEASRSS